MTHAERSAYKSGARARNEGRSRSACIFDQSKAVLRAYWLAGWHDADMGYAG